MNTQEKDVKKTEKNLTEEIISNMEFLPGQSPSEIYPGQLSTALFKTAYKKWKTKCNNL